MTGLEQKVWAATFAASYMREMDIGCKRGGDHRYSHYAFACVAAHTADDAVEALRGAIIDNVSEFVGEED